MLWGKSGYTRRQKRHARLIEEGYERRWLRHTVAVRIAWPTANKLAGVASKTHEALPGTWAFPGALDNGRIGLGWHESVGNSDSLV